MGDKDVLFMCHHGTLIVAENIHIAFDDLYYLERACMTQLMAMGASGREALKEMPAGGVDLLKIRAHPLLQKRTPASPL